MPGSANVVNKTPINATISGSTTVTIPATSAGNLLVVSFSLGSSGTTPTASGVTLGGTSLTQAFSELNASEQNAYQYYLPSITAGQTSVVISITGGTGTQEILGEVFELQGMAASSPFITSKGQVLTTAGLTTFTSLPSGTWAPGTNIAAIGQAYGYNASTTLTLATGTGTGTWTNAPQQNVSVGTGPNSSIAGYQIISGAANTSLAYAGTYTGGTSGGSMAMVGTYQVATLAVTTSGTLPGGGIGLAYSQTLAANGGFGAYTWQTTVVTGSLPPGLSISSAGVISGTPTTAGTYTFTVKVTDASSNTATSATLSITITAIGQGQLSGFQSVGFANSLTVTWPSNPVAGQKVLIGIWTHESSLTVVDNGTTPRTFVQDGAGTSVLDAWPYIYRADAITLPATGNYAVTITIGGGASNSIGAAGAAYSGVAPGGPTNSNNGGGTGTAVTTNSATPALAGALAFAVFSDVSGLNPETINLTNASFTNLGVNTNGGGANPGMVASYINPAGPTATAATWTLGDSVGWDAVIAVYDVGTPLVPANAIQEATVGFFYSETLTASGGTAPYVWSVASGTLPPGLTLSTGGQITGTPTTTGTYTFTAEVTDAHGGISTENLSITVVQPIVKAVYGQVSYGEVTYDELAAAESSAIIPTLVLSNNVANPYPLATNQALWVAEPFIAQSLNYSSVGVSWSKPIAAASATRWRLIANRYGYPVDQNDGSLLIDQPTWPGTFYLDQNVIPGSYHYYGLYAQTDPINDIWIRAAVTGCLTTENAGKSSWLQAHLPEYFTKYLDGSLTQDAQGNPFLAQFLEVLGWGLDYVQGQYDMIFRHVNDPMAIPIDDLVNLAATIGLPFDPMISIYLMRKAAANWAHVAQERGTALGIGNQIELLTGFGVDLQIGPNLMLDADQSNFAYPAYPQWNPNTIYQTGDIVQYGWWLFEALSANAGNSPLAPMASTYWSYLNDAAEPYGVLTNPNTGGVGTWEAVYPAQPQGVIDVVRGQQSTLAALTDGGAYTWASNPTAGQKVLFVCWAPEGETITQIADNGSPSTVMLTPDVHEDNGTTQVWIWHIDNLHLPASGNYAITVSTGGQGHHVMAVGVAYSGLQPGSPFSSNVNSGNTNNNPPETATIGSPLNGGVAIGVFSDGSGNVETITLESQSNSGLALNNTGTYTTGTTSAPGAAADGIVSGGESVFWYWTLNEYAVWASAVAVYAAQQQYVMVENIGDRDPAGSGSRAASSLAITNQMASTQDIYVRSISRTLADKASQAAQIPYGLALSNFATASQNGAQLETGGGFAASPATNYSGGFYVWANQPYAPGIKLAIEFENSSGTWLGSTYSTVVPLTTTPQVIWISNATSPANTASAGMVIDPQPNPGIYPSNLVIYVQQCPAQSGSNPITNTPAQYPWFKDNAPNPTVTYGTWQIPPIYVPDSLQVVNDGIPVPFTRPSFAWSPTVRYGTGDIVTWQWQPFIANRASTDATPVPGRTPSPEWSPLSTDQRLRLMVSGDIGLGNTTLSGVTPFVEWYDLWGNLITRVTARTPTAGTPGIPDQLAFDGFLLSPGSIGGRSFDNAYAHTWTAQDNNFTIAPFSGGVAYPSTNVRSVALTTGPANGQVGATLVAFTEGTMVQGVVFRWSGETAYWKATTTALVKNNGGTLTSTPYSTAANPGDRIVVQMNGSVITVLLNGVTVASITDAFNSTATQHGLIVE